MTYTLTSRPGVIRDSDGAAIPADPRNADWQVYQQWIAAGNTPSPYIAPPPPVPYCALWQLQAVLSSAQWSAVQSAVTAMSNPAVSAFFVHGTNMIPADSTTLVELGAAIGLTAPQITTLVTQAALVAIP